MIHRGPGFFAVVWFGSSPTLSPPFPLRNLGLRHTGGLRKRDNWLIGGGGWRWSQLIRRRESLVLYKSFHTLWPIVRNFEKVFTVDNHTLENFICFSGKKINFTNIIKQNFYAMWINSTGIIYYQIITMHCCNNEFWYTYCTVSLLYPSTR